MCHDILITVPLLFNRERLNVATMSNVITIWTLDMHLVVPTISSVPTTVGTRTSRPQSLRQNPPILLWRLQILPPKSVLKWRKPKICNPLINADTCDLHTSCEAACIPLMCKLPNDPHKIHGPGYTPDDRYVPLGSLCGHFRNVHGEAKPRHDIEVCCEVEDDLDSRHPHYEDEHAQCVGCYDCKFPQKVEDECCKVALGREEETGRYGNYGYEECDVDEYGNTLGRCDPQTEYCNSDCSCETIPTPAPSEPPTPAPTPKYCDVQDNPNKIHGWKENDNDNVVEQGDVCGYFKYVEGFEKPRHGKILARLVDILDIIAFFCGN